MTAFISKGIAMWYDATDLLDFLAMLQRETRMAAKLARCNEIARAQRSRSVEEKQSEPWFAMFRHAPEDRPVLMRLYHSIRRDQQYRAADAWWFSLNA